MHNSGAQAIMALPLPDISVADRTSAVLATGTEPCSRSCVIGTTQMAALHMNETSWCSSPFDRSICASKEVLQASCI